MNLIKMSIYHCAVPTVWNFVECNYAFKKKVSKCRRLGHKQPSLPPSTLTWVAPCLTPLPIVHSEEGGVVCPRGSHAELRVSSGVWITTTAAQVWSGWCTGRVCGSSRTRWRTRRCCCSSTSTSRSAATTRPRKFWRITLARWALSSRGGFIFISKLVPNRFRWVQFWPTQARAARVFFFSLKTQISISTYFLKRSFFLVHLCFVRI